jgi:hypothetical protein
MSLVRIASIAAAAALAGGIGVAETAAAAARPSSQQAQNEGRCWDPATKQVRDNAGTVTGAGTTGTPGAAQSSKMTASNQDSNAAKTGGAENLNAAGAAQSGKMEASDSAATKGAAENRPSEAQGLPDCTT